MKQRKILLATAGAAALAAASGSPAQAQDRYLGEIFQVGYTFCPRGTLEANGALLSIAQNTALFSLLGTTYGGNGQTTFALPDLRGRVSFDQGQGPGLSPYLQGEVGGQESVTLLTTQMPAHNHTGRIIADKDTIANKASPGGNALARSTAANIYADAPASLDDPMMTGTIQTDVAGGSQPHENRAPFLVTRFCVVSAGIFPSRN